MFSTRRAKAEVKREGCAPIEILSYQTCLVDSANKNGQIKKFHWVVKNSPFSLRLRSNVSEDWNWNMARVQAKVLCDSTRVQIEMPKSETVTWHLTVAPGVPSDATLTLRLTPLSSSLENSLLVVAIRISHGDQEYDLETLPLKTVSKHEQVDRKKREMGLLSDDEEEEFSTKAKKGGATKKRKQTSAECLFNELNQLRAQNDRMYGMLQILSARLGAGSFNASSSEQPPAKRRKVDESTYESIDSESDDVRVISESPATVDTSPVQSFVSGFESLMSSFASMSDDERLAVLTQLTSSPSAETTQQFALGMAQVGTFQALPACDPATCAHKIELEKITASVSGLAYDEPSSTETPSADVDSDFPLFGSSFTPAPWDSLQYADC